MARKKVLAPKSDGVIPAKKEPPLNREWFLRLIFWSLLVFGVVGSIIGNGILVVYGLAFFSLAFVIVTVFDFLGNRIKLKEASTILGGLGIFLFTIIVFLNSASLFLADGTDTCKTYPISSNSTSYFVDLNDLHVKNYGNSYGLARIVTKTNPEIKCTDCFPPEYPKLPYTKLATEREMESIQTSTVQFEIPKSITDFQFVQQLQQSDFSTPIISDRTIPVRGCECKTWLDQNKTECTTTLNPEFFMAFIRGI